MGWGGGFLNIKNIVNKLTAKYKTNNPFELAEFLKIHVHLRPLHEEVNGLYQYCDRNKFIYINSNLDYPAQKVTCGHEIGHAVLHPKLNCTFLKQYTLFSTNKFENQANIFCAHLLLSDDLLQQFKGYTTAQIYAETGVPVEYIKLLR